MVNQVWMWSNVGDPQLGRVEILTNLSVNSDCMISAEINLKDQNCCTDILHKYGVGTNQIPA